MIGAVSSIGGRNVYFNPYNNQDAQRVQQAQDARPAAAALTAHKAANPELPVQPVTAVKPVSTQAANPVSLPIRQGVDPVEMAVRMRIQPYEQGQDPAAAQNQSVLGREAAAKAPIPGLSDGAQKPEIPGLPKEKDAVQGQDQKAQDAKSAQEVMEEGECQTCKERKYQDGSDDPGVSFKTPTKMDPAQAATAVRGHEMEHVTRERAKAAREDRKVVSQNVSYQTAICPECGDVYVSGGTTRTVTAADNSQQLEQQAQQQQKQQQYQPFSAIA